MRPLLRILFCLLLLAWAANPLQAAGLHQTINFNRAWRFELADHPGAQLTKYDDATWERIGLPHSFSLPYFLSPKFYVGYGWYRKHFTVPKDWQGKRINLDFDGVFQVAEVFVNGQRVGEHKGGYTGFQFDITDAVKPGDNVVAVRVNNLWNPRLASRAGEHVFSGGIYRDVTLIRTRDLISFAVRINYARKLHALGGCCASDPARHSRQCRTSRDIVGHGPHLCGAAR